MKQFETIGAIATPPGEGGISIIKISGEKSIEIVNDIFLGKNLKNISSHTLNHGYIVENNRKIDEVLVSVMKAPNTYTGEDVVEINCHGGIILTNRILTLVFKKGVRLAQPGEFTQRAYLNNKKTFQEANNVMNLIHASNDNALDLAINVLNNSTQTLIENLREKLMQIVTNVEVNIDYPEYEDLKIVKNEDIKKNIAELINEMEEIIIDSKNGEIIKNGIKTTIIGRPNAGKSSILNYLTQKETAIVTNIKGTTRDIIESQINLDNISLNLFDTAGIRDTNDEIENIGIKKALEQIEHSRLILFILDSTQKINRDEIKIWEKIQNTNKKVIIVLNKIDQETNQKINLEALKNFDKFQLIPMSALKQKGKNNLSQAIQKEFNLEEFDALNSKYMNNLEQVLKLEQALENLRIVQQALKEEIFLDLILIDLKETLFILSDLLGLEVKEDYLNEIFSRFCLGK